MDASWAWSAGAGGVIGFLALFGIPEARGFSSDVRLFTLRSKDEETALLKVPLLA